jgi:hypothetical protein
MHQPGWRGLLADWRAELERLAADYIAGAAQVSPKRNASCTYCSLPVLCRLQARRSDAERLGASEPAANDGGEA